MWYVDVVGDVLKEFGVFGGLFVVMHLWIYKLYEKRMNDRQQEINRLAEENHEYRDRFQKLIDDTMIKKEG